MKTIIKINIILFAVILITHLCSCSTIKQPNGTIATSLLGNVVLADGSSISHEDANQTVTKLGMTNIITGGVKSLANTTTDYLKDKDSNKVIIGSNNNNLTGKLNDSAAALELERIKAAKEIEILKLTKPIEP